MSTFGFLCGVSSTRSARALVRDGEAAALVSPRIRSSSSKSTCFRRCGHVTRMGREQKFEKDQQTAGVGFGPTPKGGAAQGGEESNFLSEELSEVEDRNQMSVDHASIQDEDDPFKSTEPRKRTTVLPELSAERADELRIPFGLTQNELVERFLEADREERLLEVFVANRHLVSTSFLYNLTATILKTESMDEMKTGAKLREFRAKMIDAASIMDRVELSAAARADERVRDVVTDKDVRLAVSRKAGATTRDVDWFWVVLHAAISAWELQADEGDASPYQKAVYDQLVASLEAFLSSDTAQQNLSEECTFLSRVFGATAQEKQDMLQDVDDKLLVKLCILCCRVERLKFGAYRGLLRRLYEVRNFALKAKYGTAPRLDPDRFVPESLPVATSFDQFIRQNQTLLNRSLTPEGGGISAFGF